MKIASLILIIAVYACASSVLFAQKFDHPIIGEEVIFEEKEGIVTVEAEHFYKQTKSGTRQWYRVSKNEWPKVGRDEDSPHVMDAGNNAYLEILPDSRVTHSDKLIAGENFSNTAGEMAVLHYRVKINSPGRYYLWVRAFSTGSEDNGIHVGIDGQWPESGRRLQWCEGKNSWRWESKQRTEEVHCGEPYKIYFDIEEPGIHEIMFSMREDGFEFDRFLMTTNKEYVPKGIGPSAKLASGNLPEPFPVVTANPDDQKSYLYALEKSVPGVKMFRATAFPLEGSNFYIDKNWLAINPNQHKEASVSMEYKANDDTFDLLLLGVGENDGNSKYEVEINDKVIGKFQSPPCRYSFEEGARFIGLFESIEMKKGDKITVFAEIASNDGQEYSRARWGGVALAPVGKGAEVIAVAAKSGTQQNVGAVSTRVTTAASTQAVVDVAGELKKWHKLTLTFDGPESSETDEYNPFVNYRLNVLFTHDKARKSYLVPGYFAADGKASETSAESGNKWRVHFSPDEIGEWNYKVQFRRGNWVAVSDRDLPGESGGYMDGFSGTFSVTETDKNGMDFRARGRLEYVGEHYLKFAETGEYFLKAGVDAPENFLAYKDFDGTFHNDGHKDQLVKTWGPHVRDWNAGDPVWKDGKGKGIIGALNYLGAEGLNSVSFLTFNIKGDDQNVFPFVDYDTYDRYDISKLAQWEIVFEHAQKLGLFLHFKTQEMENQGLLDNGGVGLHRKIYYRELIARFGHHLALNWNMGEEDGDWIKNHPTPPQFKWQRLSMAAYFEDHDPYKHHRVIHNGNSFDDLLVPNTPYSGQSVQTHFRDFRLVHGDVLKWIDYSVVNGKPWAVACDEPGDAEYSLVPDNYENAEEVHRNARVNALWGTLLAGGWGIEWYFGYQPEHSDLTCENYRSRDQFWDQCRVALDFFRNNEIPYWEMKNMNELIVGGNNFCLGKEHEIFVLMLKDGGNQKMNLKKQEGKYKVQWYNPRVGGELEKGSIATVMGGAIVELGYAPAERDKDWVVLLQKI